MKKFLNLRVWVLIFFLLFSILAINPSPWASGIEVRSVQPNSQVSDAGIKPGDSIVSINRQPVKTLTDYNEAVNALDFKEIEVTIETDSGTFVYKTVGKVGFIQSNLTIVDVDKGMPLEKGMKIMSINKRAVATEEEFKEVASNLFEKKAFVLQTSRDEYPLLLTSPPEMAVITAKKSNINKGLELQGGTRVLLKPVSDSKVTENNIQDLIDVLSNRLDVYGIADLKIRPADDLAGNKFIMIEIAGVTREEVKEIIAQQGKFEAKVGEDVVFTGGKGDIAFVCRNDGSCSGIRPPCRQLSAEQAACTFQFAITITEEAAKRHAEVTKDLDINTSASGERYLSKQLDLYLDDKLVDSLNIGADLKGKPLTNIAISGPGYGTNEQSASEAAFESMNKLQTLLITGSLPFKLEIVKLDTISPVLGREFVKNSFTVAIAAIVGVSLVIFLRYRKIKIVIPMALTILCEIIITLGVAALIKWNLDLSAIAGIIAAVGTGIDDQIVITDEVMKGEERFSSWKEKIKRAFFIIIAAYATTVAAMIPLWNAGAGLVRGFAVTTIIGVTIGVLITRPAFASIIESLLEK